MHQKEKDSLEKSFKPGAFDLFS